MTSTPFEWQGLAVEERMAPVPGGEIAVSLLGNGPALVLLHGITSTGAAWGSVAGQLAADFQLIAIDHRGHGQSFKPEQGYLLTDYAADLDAILGHFGLDRPLIMGHSLGGMVALEWAIGQPDRAAALVIEDSPMRHGGEGSAEMFDGWIETSLLPVNEAVAVYREKYPAMSGAEMKRRAESITGTAMGVFTELKAAMQAHEGKSVIYRYAGINSPVQLVYGDISEGGMVPQSDARCFEQSLAQAESALLPGVGHGLHYDAPEQFLDLVTPFLKRHASNASWIGGGADQG